MEEAQTTEIVKIDASQYDLKPERATEMTAGLVTLREERKILTVQYKEIITSELTDDLAVKARTLRLLIRDNRTKGIGNWHKTQKEIPLRMGQYIDAVKRAEEAENVRMEEALMQIEKAQEIKEKQRIDKLQEKRTKEIEKYNPDVYPENLGTMDDSVYKSFVFGIKAAHDARIAEAKRLEDERIAAEKAHAEEQERIRKENERLKKEAEAAAEQARIDEARRAKEAAAREAALEKERKAIAAKQEKQRLEYEAKIKAEKEAADKAAKIQAEKLEQERKEREKVAAELKLKQDQEAARIKAEQEQAARIEAERQAQIEANLQKGDAQHFDDLSET